jgi:hypothetical protein
MRATILTIGAAALAFTPGIALSQVAPGQGQFNGQGYNHTNSGNANGQPGADCEQLILDNQGSTPGNASGAPGSPFNPDGNAGKKYAGEQPQNSRNSANSSQYDAACRDTPHSS